MRALSYILLAYLTVGLQTATAGVIRYGGASPSFVAMVVIFIALNAPREPALLGGFMIGLAADLVTQQPIGLCALSMGFVALLSHAAGRVAYRGHPMTHLLLGLVGGVICAVLAWLNGFIHLSRTARPGLSELCAGALYTALLAPIVIGILHRMRGVFGFSVTKRRNM